MTKRELHNRINAATAEIEASLHMLVIGAEGEKSVRMLRHYLYNAIRTLAYLGDALLSGDFEQQHCEGCGKPIRAGQYYFTYEDGPMVHARCGGHPNSRCAREPTVREVRADLEKRIRAAGKLLEPNGLTLIRRKARRAA